MALPFYFNTTYLAKMATYWFAYKYCRFDPNMECVGGLDNLLSRDAITCCYCELSHRYYVFTLPHPYRLIPLVSRNLYPIYQSVQLCLQFRCDRGEVDEIALA